MTAYHTEGTQIRIGNAASPEVFTAIGEVVGIGGPSGSAAVLDKTTLASVAKEKLMGLPDEGQVTLTINFDPGDIQQAALRTARANRTATNFQLAYPDSPATVDTFTAYVLTFNMDAQPDSILRGSVTLEITGPITLG